MYVFSVTEKTREKDSTCNVASRQHQWSSSNVFSPIMRGRKCLTLISLHFYKVLLKILYIAQYIIDFSFLLLKLIFTPAGIKHSVNALYPRLLRTPRHFCVFEIATNQGLHLLYPDSDGKFGIFFKIML